MELDRIIAGRTEAASLIHGVPHGLRKRLLSVIGNGKVGGLQNLLMSNLLLPDIPVSFLHKQWFADHNNCIPLDYSSPTFRNAARNLRSYINLTCGSSDVLVPKSMKLIGKNHPYCSKVAEGDIVEIVVKKLFGHDSHYPTVHQFSNLASASHHNAARSLWKIRTIISPAIRTTASRILLLLFPYHVHRTCFFEGSSTTFRMSCSPDEALQRTNEEHFSLCRLDESFTVCEELKLGERVAIIGVEEGYPPRQGWMTRRR